MAFNPSDHHRHSIRLPEHDYRSPGAYFITMCTHRRKPIFGVIENAAMRLSASGKLVAQEWSRSLEIRPEIEFDAWVIMPDHLHAIVIILDMRGDAIGAHGRVGAHGVGAHGRAPQHGRSPLPHRPPRSLGSFVAGFKSATTTRINVMRGTPGEPVWQRNYHEHVIRNAREFMAIRRYIENNVAAASPS